MSAEVVTDRFRSREKIHQRRRSPSRDEPSPRRKLHRPGQCSRKRVSFNEDADVKLFRKSDEPSHKGLSMQELHQYSNSFLRNDDSDSADSTEFLVDVEAAKKDVGEAEVYRLREKLESTKAETEFYSPLPLRVAYICEREGSIQKIQLQKRLSGPFGFLPDPSHISDEPTFDLLNTESSTPQMVDFKRTPPAHWEVKAQERPLKGILKGFTPEPSVQLVELIKKMTSHPGDFSRTQVEELLQPFKDNGELASLRAHKQLYHSLTQSPSPSPPRANPSLNVMNQPFINNIKYDSFQQSVQPHYSAPHYHMYQPNIYQPNIYQSNMYQPSQPKMFQPEPTFHERTVPVHYQPYQTHYYSKYQ